MGPKFYIDILTYLSYWFNLIKQCSAVDKKIPSKDGGFFQNILLSFDSMFDHCPYFFSLTQVTAAIIHRQALWRRFRVSLKLKTHLRKKPMKTGKLGLRVMKPLNRALHTMWWVKEYCAGLVQNYFNLL